MWSIRVRCLETARGGLDRDRWNQGFSSSTMWPSVSAATSRPSGYGSGAGGWKPFVAHTGPTSFRLGRSAFCACARGPFVNAARRRLKTWTWRGGRWRGGWGGRRRPLTKSWCPFWRRWRSIAPSAWLPIGLSAPEASTNWISTLTTSRRGLASHLVTLGGWSLRTPV